jgi:anhydro-N-acetylmuramic acid kinase
MNTPGELFLGLMSGTSMDGVDAAVVRLADHYCKVLSSLCADYPAPLRRELQKLRQDSVVCSIDQLGQLDSAVGECFAVAANAVLESAGLRREEIVAIGSHGQTLRHQPAADPPFTLQIGDPNIIASRTGITVVADFRRHDVAVGGQGAPLTPAFHRWLLADKRRDRVVLNLGGIANITVLPAGDGAVRGFDTGPGNALLDAWVKKNRGLEFDDTGAWAAEGRCSDELLACLLHDSFFPAPPPKSTGFEYFNLTWVERKLAKCNLSVPIEDVQATLAELTCRTIADAVRREAEDTSEMFVCGGGVHNRHLMARLAANLPDIAVTSTAVLGLDPDWVEAAAFAWLAKCRLLGIPGNLPSVTGASKPVLLGGIFAASL